MKLFATKHGVILDAYVKPRSRQFRVARAHDELVVYCRQPPIKGKTNRELIKELTTLFGGKAEIITGVHSQTKRILLRNFTKDQILEILQSLPKDGRC